MATLSIQVVLLTGETRTYPISVERARAMIHESQAALVHDSGWRPETFDGLANADEGVIATLMLRYFADGLRASRRRRNENPDDDILFFMADETGTAWAIPGHNIVALGVSGAQEGSRVGFQVDRGTREGKYRAPDALS
jgi:hypothetical protein